VLFFRHVARLRRWTVVPAAVLATSLAVVALPDGMLFWKTQYEDTPHVPSLVWSNDWDSTIRTLDALPGTRRVLAADWHMGRHVCSFTRHRSAFGTEYTTPYYGDRMIEVHDFRAHVRDPETPTIRWADTVLVPGGDYGWREAMRSSGRWREVQCNTSWCIFVRH
jgi:hypothetical protein